MIKTFIFSVLIVMALQVRVQDKSIENHILAWAKSSTSIGFVNEVAVGAKELTHEMVTEVKTQYQQLTEPPKPAKGKGAEARF